MVSHQPVPSRAALNALRGVILTTSCSVALLAEERRRRLQTARAAIDNARKLHSIKNNRGPIALTECPGTRKNRFAEVDDDTQSLMSLPRPRTSTRRRGRTQMIESDQMQAKNSREHDSRRTQPVHGRAESHNEHTEPGRATNFLGNGLGMGSFNRLNLDSLRSTQPQLSSWKSPRRCPRLKSSNNAVASAIPHANLIENKVASASAGTILENMMENDGSANETRSLQAAQQYLQKMGHGNLVSRPDYGDAIPVLERLLTELETPTANTDLYFERLNIVRTIFDKLVSFGPLPQAARPVQFHAIRLFRILTLTCPENITATLSSLLPLSKDPMKLLVPFIAFLQSSNHRELLRQVFLFLSRESTLCLWEDGKLVSRLLSRLARSQQDFVSIKDLYLEFQAFGLFSDFEVRLDVECTIRRTMIILALEADENEYASTELQKLEEVYPGASGFDFRLQQHIIAKKASNGKWDQVWSHIDMLRPKKNSRCLRFQRLLKSVTDNFVTQCQDHDEFEEYLRKAVADFNLRLEPRWIYAVLDGYASRRQADSAISWLEFCGENGLLTDTSLNQQFFARCRKYWSFSEKAMRRFARLLNTHGLATKQSLGPILGADSNRHTNPGSPLKQAVLEQLECETPDMQRATQLVAFAHSKGVDISDALTPLLIAQSEQGEDPRPLINNALQSGIRLHDSTYNKAAQALSTGGNHRAAIEMCEIAARENGNGQLLYNQYNFANLVYAYIGTASYTALQAVLSEFTSETQWWHGSPICKESIKLAMKAAAMRAVVDTPNSELHRQALNHLDTALLHVKECRASKKERLSVTEAYVRFAKAALPKAPPKVYRELTKKKHGVPMRHPCVAPDAAPDAAQTPVECPEPAAAIGSA
ncbi:hypothetical protein E4U21_003183 [Claviceps maximensis]|nr:hypothetical protein E4U21_003183 [Claviceps maximensis]